MAGVLSTLGDFVAGVAKAASPVVDTIYANKTTQTQLKLQELQTREAVARKEAAQAAAANTSKFFGSKTAETVIIWTVTTIAGGVLVGVVMKLAGFSK